MPIIRSTDRIVRDHPIFLIVGETGVSKTSLGYSHPALLVDFDLGAHRAANRGDTLTASSWAQVQRELSGEALGPYSGVTVDTVERCLGLMTTAVIAADGRCGSADGVLSPKGWGVLKLWFSRWLDELQVRLQKDVLLLAHAKETRDRDHQGRDRVKVKADCPGGSYGEIMKRADFVGYLAMRGNDRVLDFSPTERFLGKNPAGWAPMRVPPIAEAGSFMRDLFDRGREALGQLSENSACVAASVDAWREDLRLLVSAADFTASYAKLRETKERVPAVYAQVYHLFVQASRGAGVRYDADLGAFRPVPAASSNPCQGDMGSAPSVASIEAEHQRFAQSGRVATIQPQLLSALTRVQ